MYVCNSNYVAGESTVRIVNYTDWQTRNGPVDKTVTQLVTPKVVVCDRYAWKVVIVGTWHMQEVGQRHFGCSTLEGVQLEDQGGSGTAASHWEKRLLLVNYHSINLNIIVLFHTE